MKYFSFVLAFLFLCGQMEGVEPIENQNEISRILTSDQGILIRIGEEWIQAEALHAASSGMFVLLDGEWVSVEEAIELGGRRDTWKCKCGFENYVDFNYCSVCGAERPKEKKTEVNA